MDTPGYDPPCTTGLIAGGANVLVFTTGRGSVLGLKPTPCIKLATNTPMYERMIADMDMDAGPILEGEPVEAVGRRLFDMILDVASGALPGASSKGSVRRSSRLGPSGRLCEAATGPWNRMTGRRAARPAAAAPAHRAILALAIARAARGWHGS